VNSNNQSPKHLINIIEVVYNHPAEIFIQRHCESINNSGINIEIVVRHADSKLAHLASMGQSYGKTNIMPNFDRLKLIKERFLIRNSSIHFL